LALPVADRIAEVTRIEQVLWRMFSPGLHRDPAPIAVFAIDDENAAEFGLVDELHSIRDGEEAHTAGGLAPGMRIVEATPGSAVFLKCPRPILERNLFQRKIRRQARAAGADRTAACDIPESLNAWSLTQIHSSVRPVRSRLGRRGRRSSAARATAAASSACLASARRRLSQKHRQHQKQSRHTHHHKTVISHLQRSYLLFLVRLPFTRTRSKFLARAGHGHGP